MADAASLTVLNPIREPGAAICLRSSSVAITRLGSCKAFAHSARAYASWRGRNTDDRRAKGIVKRNTRDISFNESGGDQVVEQPLGDDAAGAVGAEAEAEEQADPVLAGDVGRDAMHDRQAERARFL
eukprot:2998248-Rhodomonas_salina.1